MRKLAAGLSIGVSAAAIVLLLGAFGVLEKTELQTYDWRMRQAYRARARSAGNPFPINDRIVLVEITDASIRDFMPAFGRWPWPRVAHAMLIDYLTRGSPKVIAVDLSFLEPERPATYDLAGESWTSQRSDQAFADAVKRAGNVILLADAVNPGLTEGNAAGTQWRAPAYRLDSRIEPRPLITLPYDALAGAARGFGHNYLTIDPDGPARRIAPFIREDERYMPSLGVAAALASTDQRAEEVVIDGDRIRLRNGSIPLLRTRVSEPPGSPLRDQWTMLINYRAPVSDEQRRRPFATYEVRYLLASEDKIQRDEKPDVDPAVFKDKIVFIGLAASGLVDVFQTPQGAALMPGIQLHASVADSVLSNLYIRRAGEWTRIAAVAGGAIAIGLLAAAMPFSAAAVGALLGIGGWTWLSLVLFRGGTWINLTQPTLAVAASLFAGTAYRYFVEGREKRKVKTLFGRYVSKDVYAQLLENPSLAELGGRRRDMTVLFSDIRGFTSVTEKGNPEELVSQLNEYFSRMVAIVFRHHGTVDKFVGDMVMALFSAPVDDPEHAEHAVQAAIDMVRDLGELNRKWANEGRAQLDIGVGVNSGEMIAGNIGSSSIMSYTVIGDNVNLGSRLESLNKEYKTRVIISDATRVRLKGSYEIRPLGDVVVKGKTRPVVIFEVVVPSPLPAPVPPGERAAAQEGVL